MERTTSGIEHRDIIDTPFGGPIIGPKAGGPKRSPSGPIPRAGPARVVARRTMTRQAFLLRLHEEILHERSLRQMRPV